MINDGTPLALNGNDACDDPDGDPMTFEVTLWPAGSLTGDPNTGVASYLPSSTFSGTATLKFRAHDSNGEISDEATTLIHVSAPPGAGGLAPACPTAHAFVETGGQIVLFGNCVDPEGQPLSYGLPGLPFVGGVFLTPHGSLTPLGGATVNYVHNGDSATSDGFNYTANDGFVTTTATVDLSIVPPGTTEFATAPEATPSDPYVVNVATTQAGNVSFSSRAITTATPPGTYVLFGPEIVITAPAGSQTSPLTIVFTIDKDSLPIGQDHNTVEVVRNGTVVPACGPSGTEVDDPCVSLRQPVGDGDAEVTVKTSQASVWNLAINTAPVAKKPGKGCGDKNHVHQREAGCKKPAK